MEATQKKRPSPLVGWQFHPTTHTNGDSRDHCKRLLCRQHQAPRPSRRSDPAQSESWACVAMRAGRVDRTSTASPGNDAASSATNASAFVAVIACINSDASTISCAARNSVGRGSTGFVANHARCCASVAVMGSRDMDRHQINDGCIRSRGMPILIDRAEDVRTKLGAAHRVARVLPKSHHKCAVHARLRRARLTQVANSRATARRKCALRWRVQTVQVLPQGLHAVTIPVGNFCFNTHGQFTYR